MGIDPLTHKPLPPPSAVQPPPELQEQPPEAEEAINAAAEPIISEPATQIDENEETVELINNNDFCIDEIPVIEPHEILLGCDENSSSASSSSSSSSSSNSSYSPKEMLEELHFSPSFEDYCSEIMMNSLWCDDFNGLDLMMNSGDDDQRDCAEANSLLQYPIMVMDEDYSWSFWALPIFLNPN